MPNYNHHQKKGIHFFYNLFINVKTEEKHLNKKVNNFKN